MQSFSREYVPYLPCAPCSFIDQEGLFEAIEATVPPLSAPGFLLVPPAYTLGRGAAVRLQEGRKERSGPSLLAFLPSCLLPAPFLPSYILKVEILGYPPSLLHAGGGKMRRCDVVSSFFKADRTAKLVL